MSSSYSPCAACKFLRRKCTQECVFAPYFPPDQPQRFANVHRVFGASNVSKLLNDLNPAQRQDAVNSLAYEADARLHDPVYGCVGVISIMQKQLKQIQNEIYHAKKELATYIGPSAMMPIFHPSYNPSSSSLNHMPMGIPDGAQAHHLQQQQQEAQHLMEAQQLAGMTLREEQEMMGYWEQQQQQLLLGYGGSGSGGGGVGSSSGGRRFHQVGSSLVLGVTPFDLDDYHHQIQQQQQQGEQQGPLLVLEQQEQEHEHGPLLLFQQQAAGIRQQQQDEQQGPLLVLQQPVAVTVQQQGVGDQVPQAIPQQLQGHLVHHNHHLQRSVSGEDDNTVGPSC